MLPLLPWAAMLTAPPSPIARIAAPARPAQPTRQPFPLIATLAPVVMSVVLWLITQSVFSLIFAALGPVVAIASVVDSRLGGRRRSRAERARFAVEITQVRSEIRAEHERERGALAARAPSAASVVVGPQHAHWSDDPHPLLVLGLADLRSTLAIDGATEGRGVDPVDVALRDLRTQAAVVTAAPLVVGAGRGVGIAGPPALAGAFARALLVQLLAHCSPVSHDVRGDEGWLDEVPHNRLPGSALAVQHDDEIIRIELAEEPTALRGVDTVVRLDGASAEVLRGEHAGTRFSPEYLGAEQALAWTAAAREVAQRSGALRSTAPTVVAFADLPQPGGGALRSVIGSDASGAVAIDLAGDGPHAVVGGTTGSGKSELLVSWLLGMAATRSPDELSLLLVDFKGGTSFGALPTLPHCVGLVTDLDRAGAARALASLAAELRHRERTLAAAGAKSIDQLPQLARLVIAVDEFAAMAADLPDLHAQFSDIAARGRSLGVHLVLCTQRPAGVVRDAVLANASLRLSLRVNNRADSTAVIGTDAAARGQNSVPGRAWLAIGAAEPREVQVAMAADADVARIARRWADRGQPRRPWLDPLPSTLAPSSAPGAIGLVDLPAEQAQHSLPWHPASGTLLVVGAGGSGKTSALRAIESVHGGVIVGDHIERVWDLLADPPAVLLLDDVDSLLARVQPDYQQALLDRLAVVLRGGETRVVLTAQRLGASLQQLSALCDNRLLLRMPTKQEHVIAGGSSETFDPDLPPGAGWWRGYRVQLVLVHASPPAVAPPSEPWSPAGPAIAVTPRPQALAARLANSHIEVADPDTWLANWGRFSSLAATVPVLFHECSPTEFRQLSRRRTLPPPIADPRTTAWLLEPEAEPVRVRLVAR